MPDAAIDIDRIDADAARAIIHQYRFSNAKLSAHVKARNAFYANFPFDASAAQISAENLALEISRRCGFRDAIDMATLRSAILDMVFAAFGTTNDLIDDREYDLLTAAVKGILF